MWLLFCALFIFWLVYPYKVIDFKSVVVKSSYKQGDVFSMKIEYCKYMPLPTKMTRQFLNGVIYTLNDNVTANSPVGCKTNESRDIKIPSELPAGKYTYRQTMEYQVNPIRRIIVVFETDKFEVL
jgi:hypothetical protein